jgi:hypothetical protein
MVMLMFLRRSACSERHIADDHSACRSIRTGLVPASSGAEAQNLIERKPGWTAVRKVTAVALVAFEKPIPTPSSIQMWRFKS